MPSWVYDETTHRYRDTATGRYLSPSTMVSLRDDAIERSRASVRALAESVASGDLSVQDWLVEMRDQVQTVTRLQYLFGRGGRHAARSSDRAVMATLVDDQWAFLQGFAEAVQAGRLSANQIRARAGLYLDSSVHAYERGRAASRIGLELPAYPGDGSTACRARCRCTWVIQETPTAWICRWTLDQVAEHCADCTTRARTYRRLVISKTDDDDDDDRAAPPLPSLIRRGGS